MRWISILSCGTFPLIKHMLQQWRWPNDDHETFSKLPKEIIILIFTKLPAETLVELRCVSKFFESMISQPYFLQLHLSCIPDQLHQHLYFIGYNSSPGEFYLCRHRVESGRRVFSASRLSCDQFHSTVCFSVHLVGSTRGIVCLFNWDRNCKSFSLTLWNPSIGKSKKLPILPDFCNLRKGIMDCFNIVLGFAFDHKAVDFKLVVILYDKPKGGLWKTGRYPAKYFVYAEKKKSWSDVTQLVLPCYIVSTDGFLFKRNVSVNGVAYWLAKKEMGEENACIMGFDLVSEVFEVLELPQDVSMQLGNLRLFSLVDEKSLALFVRMEGNSSGYVYSKNWSLWVMNAGDEKKRWEKRYNLVLDYPVLPLGMVNGRQLLADLLHASTSNYALVDVAKKSYKELQVCGLPTFNRIIGYVPSLALLDT